jgi:hypothetical protein
VLRRFCRECQRRTEAAAGVDNYRIAIVVARVLVYAGVALGLLALVSPYLGMQGHPGFGWRQITGTEIGFLVLALGMLNGRPLPSVIGLFLFVLSLGADFFEIGRSPGIGWRKQIALAVATALILGGSLWGRALWRWTKAAQSVASSTTSA